MNQTLAEITADLQQYSWFLMDEEQKDELMTKKIFPLWGQTTADGHELKARTWARVLGTTFDTIDSRAKRLRRSQAQDDGSISDLSDAATATIRHVRLAVLRHPEQVASNLARNPAALKAAEQVVHQAHLKAYEASRQRVAAQRGESFSLAPKPNDRGEEGGVRMITGGLGGVNLILESGNHIDAAKKALDNLYVLFAGIRPEPQLLDIIEAGFEEILEQIAFLRQHLRSDFDPSQLLDG